MEYHCDGPVSLCESIHSLSFILSCAAILAFAKFQSHSECTDNLRFIYIFNKEKNYEMLIQAYNIFHYMALSYLFLLIKIVFI